MTGFQKYNTIENSYRTKVLKQITNAVALGYCKDDFIVEEKAHGANFSFYYDGLEHKTASRNDFLEADGETFLKSHLVKKRYTENVEELYKLVGKPIRVIGEIIGGSYNHPDIEEDADIPRVQKGVEYCPGLDFYAFDISTWDEIKKKYVIMNKMEANGLLEQTGLFYARPLFRGTLQECLDYDNTFKSHISKWLGLPEHPGPNLAEGKVIKPVDYACLGDGSRIILKDKTESFSEISGSCARSIKKKEKSSKPTWVLSDEGTRLKEILVCHINENRLRNVLSKLSTVPKTQKDFGHLVGLLSKDALEDFDKDYSAEFDHLEKKEKKAIKNALAQEAKMLVTKHAASMTSQVF